MGPSGNPLLGEGVGVREELGGIGVREATGVAGGREGKTESRVVEGVRLGVRLGVLLGVRLGEAEQLQAGTVGHSSQTSGQSGASGDTNRRCCATIELPHRSFAVHRRVMNRDASAH